MAVHTETKLFSNVYCPGCKRTIEYVIEEFPADHGAEHRTQEIVCPDCFYIIATFHER